jgi:hypothetical protein
VAVSQRSSGYAREPLDRYETPAWVTAAVVPHINKLAYYVWEPACGSGAMADALRDAGFYVHATDIESGTDFLAAEKLPELIQAVVTNPPYGQACEFIEHSPNLTRPVGGAVAVLLRIDYDSARTRRHLFAEHEAFAKKLVLTRRIRWFAESTGSPSFNHAWFIWDWQHLGAPRVAYA